MVQSPLGTLVLTVRWPAVHGSTNHRKLTVRLLISACKEYRTYQLAMLVLYSRLLYHATVQYVLKNPSLSTYSTIKNVRSSYHTKPTNSSPAAFSARYQGSSNRKVASELRRPLEKAKSTVVLRSNARRVNLNRYLNNLPEIIQ